ncbi:transposable element Tcb2 transposase [Trichonephila clavipes]|nr:transposable element Tcb2 transposase [Trichonephila clavipes]
MGVCFLNSSLLTVTERAVIICAKGVGSPRTKPFPAFLPQLKLLNPVPGLFCKLKTQRRDAMSCSHQYAAPSKAGRRAVLLARWIVRRVLLEIVGSSGHEKVPTRGKPGLERTGRPRGERRGIVRQALVDPTVTRSTIRADVGVAIVPQTISRHLVEANLKSKCPFRALPLTPEHRQLRLQWWQTRSIWNVTDWQKFVFSDESRFVLGTDDNRVRVWRRPAYDSRSTLIVMRGTITGQRYVDDILRPHTLPWPARTPDLFLVEHVWDQLKRQMPSCHSVHDLELAVQDLWAHLSQDNIGSLIN